MSRTSPEWLLSFGGAHPYTLKASNSGKKAFSPDCLRLVPGMGKASEGQHTGHVYHAWPFWWT